MKKVSEKLFKDLKFVEENLKFEDIIKFHSSNKWSINYCEDFRSLTVKELAEFLINSYEIEQTPEEQVQDYYAEIARHVEYSESNGELNKAGQNALKIIRDIVGILGHKIKGIND